MTITGSATAAGLISELAVQHSPVLTRRDQLEKEIEQGFFALPEAAILRSLPGIGPRLGARIAAPLLLVAFIGRQATHARPLLPLSIFKSRNLSGANLVQMLMVAAMFGMFFLGSLYLQRVLRYDAMQIGLAFLPVAPAIGALSIDVAARLSGRFGARTVLLCGLTFILAGLAVFAVAPVDAQYMPQILPAMALLGLGGGLSFPSLSGASYGADVDQGAISW